jgi:hypothetical protein
MLVSCTCGFLKLHKLHELLGTALPGAGFRKEGTEWNTTKSWQILKICVYCVRTVAEQRIPFSMRR